MWEGEPFVWPPDLVGGRKGVVFMGEVREFVKTAKKQIAPPKPKYAVKTYKGIDGIEHKYENHGRCSVCGRNYWCKI